MNRQIKFKAFDGVQMYQLEALKKKTNHLL